MTARRKAPARSAVTFRHATPDQRGRFGAYGGRFVPETVMFALDELTCAYAVARGDKQFQRRLRGLLADYAGRPTPITYAERFSGAAGRPVYLKREDLLHTGAHKLNNCLGQALLAVKMKKRRIIAETGAGQHGLATATVCALFGLECVIYMGAEDVKRQSANVRKMRLLGANVVTVDAGSATLKDATNEAMRDWVSNIRLTYYIIGSVVGPHPYPMIVRDFQRVIGAEARSQFRKTVGRLPGAVIACVGGGSNAIGIFTAFLRDKRVRLVGVEAAGEGIPTGRHSATLTVGKPGVLHGSFSYALFDDNGQIQLPHSISAGLDYPGVGPEHSYLKDSGRVTYVAATDEEALSGFHALANLEGIVPALESSHALGYLLRASGRRRTAPIPLKTPTLVCLSGRGDKDMDIIAERGKQADTSPQGEVER